MSGDDKAIAGESATPPPVTAEQARRGNAASDDDDGDRPSVTDAGGSVARFEMAYSPQTVERSRFGAPMRELVPSFVYLGVVAVFTMLVAIGYSSSYGSKLYQLTIQADRGRPFPASVLAIFLVVSALGTVLRATMRGVVVDESGIEVRAILLLGIPRLRRWAWAQVHRIVIDERRVMLELWDGSHEFLPDVADRPRLAETLNSIAARRRITITHLVPGRPG